MKLRYIATLVILLAVILGIASVASAQNTTTHVVQPGQTLYSIARQYGVTVQEIVFANGITNPDRIYVGQVLIIPIAAQATPPPGETAAPPTTTTTYTVVAGDTLFSIARRFGTTISALVSLNNLTNPDRLSIGQVLKIPSQGTPATETPATEGSTSSPEPTATTAPVTTVTYVVQTGDTLSSIALRFNMTYQEIALLNGLDNPNLIFVGQTLIIKQGSAAATATPTATATQGSTSPTEEPTTAETTQPGFSTPTPIISGTQVPAGAANKLQEPGFEADVHRVEFDDINVVNGWEPFYCDKPYTADFCPALRIGSGNPEGMVMIRPAYGKTLTSFRIHSGSAAQTWSCTYGACRAGVYQVVNTTAGKTCEAGAYVQSWSTDDPLSFTSQLVSFDDRSNSTWTIRVDLGGGTNAFEQGLLASRGFGYDDDIYDHYAPISYTFVTTGAKTTLFFEDLRLWSFANNASFIDDVYFRCAE